MNTKVLYLFTRTPLHVGDGPSVGAIDQPIRREGHTGFPIIPGSAIKGVLADLYLENRSKGLRSADGIALFGRQDHEVVKDDPTQSHKSGDLSIGDAGLLAFPVRSAKGCFAWITSHLLIKRWEEFSGKKASLPGTLPTGSQVYGPNVLAESDIIVLEDYALARKEDFVPGDPMKEILPDSLWSELCDTHLCLISDDMMAHFARTTCEVAQHVSINDETGTADDGRLFNQENVPADTIFYSAIIEMRPGSLDKLNIPEILQIGGDATTGLGFCSTSWK